MRSSREHFVKTSAPRWVSLALLTPVPWASRVWSLPFLSALAYYERYAQEQGKRHKTLTEWAWQLLLLVRRWYPEREIVAVADGGYASLKLLDRCRRLNLPSFTLRAPNTHTLSGPRLYSRGALMRCPSGDHPGAGGKERGVTGPSSSTQTTVEPGGGSV